MLGCARCMGQINTEPNHCCYCDAPSLGKPLGDQIESLQKEVSRLKFFEDKLSDSIMLGAAEKNMKEVFVEHSKELYDALKLVLPWAGEEVRDNAGFKDWKKATDAARKAIERYENDEPEPL